MIFAASDIQVLVTAFQTFLASENKQDQQQIVNYLFDLLHRTPAEQDAERARWLETERRLVDRQLPDFDATAQKQRDMLVVRRDAAAALSDALAKAAADAGKTDPAPTPAVPADPVV